ncbi:MAG: hypothetical protein JXK95_09585 [Bacteroidales bacterium]|nr:hypothetical protein [Bacteroidales bacterium]
MRMLNIITHIALITCIIIGLTNCDDDSENQYDTSLITFDSIKIALYIDDAVWPNCKLYTETKLKEIGLPYTVINKDTILKGNLIFYSVIIIPGGKPDLYEQNLEQEGLNIINNYVSRGGGYIGICGGTYLAAQTNIWRGWAGEPRTFFSYTGMLNIFKGTADGPIEDYAPTYKDYNCGVKIINKEHPVTNDLPDTIYYLYDHGPMLIKEDDPNAIDLGKSLKGDKVLILTTQYKNGRIFLTSGHPEVMSSKACEELIENAIVWCSKLNN